MLKTIGKRANFARWRESGIALGIALGIVLSVVAPIRDVRAAEGDRTVRMAKFARPATVPFPPENPIRLTRPNSGENCFSTP